MKAEILSTGDELRTGTLVDSNTAYIAEQLESEGIEVIRHSTVGDDLAQLVQVLLEMSSRSDFAVVTGGLGPTTDDISREAAAEAAGVQLVRDEEALDSLESFFRNRNRPVGPANLKLALLPETAACIRNPQGTAPGFRLKLSGCSIFFLPGVPSEMKRMLAESVLPAIRHASGNENRISCIRTFRSFGLTELSAGEKLEGFDLEFPHLKLGYRACFPEIQVKIYASGSDGEKLRQEVGAADNWIRERIGTKIFSDNGDSMEEVVAKLLRRENATIAAAEQCTGGLVADLLTDVPGSDDFFLSSAVSSSTETLQKMLAIRGPRNEEVNGGAADTSVGDYSHDQMNEETEIIAREMAVAVKKNSGATFGLSTICGTGAETVSTSAAGHEGRSITAGQPEAVLCVGLAAPGGTRSRTYRFSLFNPAVKKAMFVMAALNMLRKELISGD